MNSRCSGRVPAGWPAVVVAAGLAHGGCTPDVVQATDATTMIEGTTQDAATSTGGTQPTADVGTVEADCFVQEWVWVGDDPWWSTRGALANSGADFVTVGRLAAGPLALAVSGDGTLAWGPSPLAQADDGLWHWSGVVGVAGGDVVTLASATNGAWFERRSAGGVSQGAVQLPGVDRRVGPAALASNGEIVTGGFIGPDEFTGMAALLSAATTGAPNWEVGVEHDIITALTIDAAGTIFLLAADLEIEGGTVFLEARDATGGLIWSTLAQTTAGFGSEGPLSPFALAADQAGGVLTVGSKHTLATPDQPAKDALLFAHHDASGARTWQVESDLSGAPLGGALAVTGPDAIALATGSVDSTRLALHTLDGDLRCEQIVPGASAYGMLSPARDEVVLAGVAGSESKAWLARYRIAPL